MTLYFQIVSVGLYLSCKMPYEIFFLISINILILKALDVLGLSGIFTIHFISGLNIFAAADLLRSC